MGEFVVGDHDELLGHIGGAPVFIGGPHYEARKHTDLIIDVVSGRDGMFSLDSGARATVPHLLAPLRSAALALIMIESARYRASAAR